MIAMKAESFTCPKCERTSHHPMDVHEQYCGACHEWFNEYGPMHYDRAGKPIPLSRWGELHTEYSYVNVADTYRDRGNLRVSTVWLGVDHSFVNHLPPIIFETAVFSPDGLYIADRYPTLAAALKGHKREVMWVTRNVPFSNPQPLSKPGRLVSKKFHARKSKRVMR